MYDFPSYNAAPGPSRQHDDPPSYKEVMRTADSEEKISLEPTAPDDEKISLKAYHEPIITQPSTSTDVILEIEDATEPDDREPTCNAKCFRCRIFIIFMIGFGIFLCSWDADYRRYRASDEYNREDVPEGLDSAASTRGALGGVILAVGVICYLVDAITANFAKIVCFDSNRLENHLETVKKGKPKLTWHMKCFHRDTGTVIINDPEAGPRTETKNDILPTWSGTQEFHFTSWSDETEDQTDKMCGISQITFHKTFVFANATTQESYNAQKQAFINANKDRDTEYSIQDIFEIEGYQRKLTAVSSCSGCCCCCCTYLFVVSSFLLYPWLCCWSFCCSVPVEYTHTVKLSV
ncbi:uncharacterized protein LOC129595131 [Paramacrobiotus metropolitanus]|uniref:uncharacterized protein LOC129595131 n=1 Tax=Paramacrobiotus metropolitanus TaxID=2943436 RepID=UPI002446181C|nr:uncharacterized protein LOC129595131 [Paramacrobiotus metropolitanus]